MRLPSLCVVVLMFLLLPTTVQAHDHVWDFSFGPAAASGSRLWGGHFAIGLTNPVPANRDLSWLIDVTNVKGKDGANDITQNTYLGGARYALLGNRTRDKNILMLHGLIGTVYKQNGADGDFEFATKIGAAYERLLVGPPPAGWALRVQLERSFVTDGPVAKEYTQIAVGIVKRFD